MSHDKGLCSKCNQGWQSHTLVIGTNGFSRKCYRNPDDGIDPCMQELWSKLVKIEELNAAVVKLNEDMAKLKSSHVVALDAKQKLLDDQMIALQSARAKADGVDRILTVELGHARTAMEATHKAAIKTMSDAKDEAMRIMREGMQVAYDELENRYNATQTLLRGTEANVQARVAENAQLEAQLSAQRTVHAEELAGADRRHRELDDRFAEANRAVTKAESAREAALAAQAKAERHACAAEGSESNFREAYDRLKIEHDQLMNRYAAVTRQPGAVEHYRREELLTWFEAKYGKAPEDVEKKILIGLPVVPEMAPIPTPVATTPTDDSLVPQSVEASSIGEAAAPVESPIEPPSTNVDDAQIVAEAAASGHEPDPDTQPAIELSMQASCIIHGVDEILEELAPPEESAETKPTTCESPAGCASAPTKVATLVDAHGEATTVHACDWHAAHPASFVPGLIELGLETDEDNLRDLFDPPDEDSFIPPDLSTLDAPQEVSHA